ncbi:MAG: glycosyltransferase family 4 protein [Vicinamibacteraceae bacterium]
MEPIRVLHVRDSSGLFGAERVILTLARNIDRSRFEFHLLCMRRRDGRSEPFMAMARRNGIHVIPLEVDRRFDVGALKSLRQIIREHRIAILHAHDYKADLYALLASLHLPVKRVLTSHGSTRDSLIKKLYLSFDERVIYPRYDRIIAVSEDLGRALHKRSAHDDKVRVVQNGLDFNLLSSQTFPEDSFASRLGSIKRSSGVLVAVVGRLFPDKGHQYFLQAFERLRGEHRNVKALIVGDGPEKERLARWITSHRLEDDVFMCGFVSDMQAVYQAINCLVMPSLTEGLPYTLLEAMHYGVPVIATAVGDIPRLIRPEATGILIAPGDADDIFHRLDEFVRGPAKARQLAKEATRLVHSEFSAGAMARRVEDLYLDLMSSS